MQINPFHKLTDVVWRLFGLVWQRGHSSGSVSVSNVRTHVVKSFLLFWVGFRLGSYFLFALVACPPPSQSVPLIMMQLMDQLVFLVCHV